MGAKNKITEAPLTKWGRRKGGETQNIATNWATCPSGIIGTRQNGTLGWVKKVCAIFASGRRRENHEKGKALKRLKNSNER